MADLSNSQDTTSTEVVNETSGNKLALDSDGSIIVSLCNTVGKTLVGKTGTITTTATTADQVVLTYTVTALKTFLLQYVTLAARLTTLPGNANPIALGEMSLEVVSGTKVMTFDMYHFMQNPNKILFSEPMVIAAGTVVRVVCTPAAATSTRWRANFGGFEK